MADSPAEKLAQQTQKLVVLIGFLLVCIIPSTIFFSIKTVKELPKTWACGNDTHQGSPNFEKGKLLFLDNCASCHHKNMTADLTGPALMEVEANWSGYPRSELFEFIRYSQKSIKKGQPRAKKVWKKFRPEVMNDFPGLSDDQIEAILAYVRMRY